MLDSPWLGHYGPVSDVDEDGVGGDEDNGEPSFAVVRALVLVLLLFADGGASCTAGEEGVAADDMPVELLLIPLSHLHNVILSIDGDMSSIPAAIIPFNGARVPVELV